MRNVKIVHVESPLHSTGTPDILQARGREIASVRFIGTWKGTPPVTIRHKQSCPLLIRFLSELQQSEVGEDALERLARKPIQLPKLLNIAPVQALLVWPTTGMARTIQANIKIGMRHGKVTNRSINLRILLGLDRTFDDFFKNVKLAIYGENYKGIYTQIGITGKRRE